MGARAGMLQRSIRCKAASASPACASAAKSEAPVVSIIRSSRHRPGAESCAASVARSPCGACSQPGSISAAGKSFRRNSRWRASTASIPCGTNSTCRVPPDLRPSSAAIKGRGTGSPSCSACILSRRPPGRSKKSALSEGPNATAIASSRRAGKRGAGARSVRSRGMFMPWHLGRRDGKERSGHGGRPDRPHQTTVKKRPGSAVTSS